PPPGETDPNYWYKKLNKLARQSRETYIRKDLRDQLIEKTRREFALSDDIVNSEEKLHALFLKWISCNECHFDVEDKAAFKERFDIFKANARFCHHKNKSGHGFKVRINRNADLTSQEFRTGSWKTYPMKADQVIPGIFSG
ncbi:hypothetical protein MKW94_003978, partial [Papaver nudicaule]|nr:hypothetical protein [Papaver nudicaule]